MNFIIAVETFDEKSGGNIVLHMLCQRLVEAGEAAFVWPVSRPRLQFWRDPRRYAGWLLHRMMRRNSHFDTGPFTTKLAGRKDFAGAVVVYPEVIAGDPLGTGNVVRWLLHRPGFHTGKMKYGKNDLLFYYQEAFYNPDLGDYKDNRLVVTWWNQEYRKSNDGERSGSCYLLRKVRDVPIVHDPRDAILIDSLSHREKAEVFNRTEYFYSYDPYTLYARYAALCGCIPIIVPQPEMTRDQWVPYEEERYGLAYGEEDVDWAVATRPLMLRQIELEQEMEAAMLRSFIQKCYARFS